MSDAPSSTSVVTDRQTPASSPLRSLETQSSPAPQRRVRGSVACRRCRRYRCKCIHVNMKPPCEACVKAGIQEAETCSFPQPGEKLTDREHRRRISRSSALGDRSWSGCSVMTISETPENQPGGQEAATASINPKLPIVGPQLTPDPPLEEVVEGCRIFLVSYFQLGFIPKSVFLESLVRDAQNVSQFLVYSILCISARFTPSLVTRFGSPASATAYFESKAHQMVPDQMYKPSLENIQAFFLLAVAEWGNGEKQRSSMDMGIAVRMAGLLKLHCEESYALAPDATAEQIVRSESARRTFWMIQSQENLHSGYKTPAPFPLEAITTLLPCNEHDFAFACLPKSRAAVNGTPPAVGNPDLVYAPDRCLFASLIQVHGLWGTVARQACRTDANINNAPPWSDTSSYAETMIALDKWEDSLPMNHRFSVWNLRGWKSESLHLAYLAVTMVIRLSNIVLRRVYMEDMVSALTPDSPAELLDSAPSMAALDDEGHERPREKYPEAPVGFWTTMASQLFKNVQELHEQIDAYFVMRTPNEGFPQILVFCVYMCGSMASSLWQHPALCPEIASDAEQMAMRSLQVLNVLKPAWPGSGKWPMGVSRGRKPLPSGNNRAECGPNDVGGVISDSARVNFTGVALDGKHDGTTLISAPATTNVIGKLGSHVSEATAMTPLGAYPAGTNMSPHGPTSSMGAKAYTGPQQDYGPDQSPHDVTGTCSLEGDPVSGRVQQHDMHSFPNEIFDAELSAFLQGDLRFENWNGGVSSG